MLRNTCFVAPVPLPYMLTLADSTLYERGCWHYSTIRTAVFPSISDRVPCTNMLIVPVKVKFCQMSDVPRASWHYLGVACRCAMWARISLLLPLDRFNTTLLSYSNSGGDGKCVSVLPLAQVGSSERQIEAQLYSTGVSRFERVVRCGNSIESSSDLMVRGQTTTGQRTF